MLTKLESSEIDQDLIKIKMTLSTDKQCREYLVNILWKDKYICSKCNYTEAWLTKDISFKCKKCGHKMTATKGTVFEETRIPLDKWFTAIWLIAKYGTKITSTVLQEKLELGSNRTALNMLKTINKSRYTTVTKKLEHTVEINHFTVKIGAQNIPIIIAAEIIGTTIGQIRIAKINLSEKAKIAQFIKDNIEPYDLIVCNYDTETKRKKIGIVAEWAIQECIGTEYNKITKMPLYEYRFTKKVYTAFSAWVRKYPLDKFDVACKRYCDIHNTKFVSMSFKELLSKVIKQKPKRKKP